MARHPKSSSPKLTNELIEAISEAIRLGSYVETAVALCGISKQTFYRWLKEAQGDRASDLHLKLSDAVKKALAESETRDLAVIDRAAQDGMWQAAAWRLERKFPDRWGRQSKVHLEPSGPEGQPIEITDARETLKKVLSDPAALIALETLETKIGNADDSED